MHDVSPGLVAPFHLGVCVLSRHLSSRHDVRGESRPTVFGKCNSPTCLDLAAVVGQARWCFSWARVGNRGLRDVVLVLQA